MDNSTFQSTYRLFCSPFVGALVASLVTLSELPAQDFEEVLKGETQRRKDNAHEAKKLVLIGDAAYEAKDFKEAVDSYGRALGLLPDAVVVEEYEEAVNARYRKAIVAYSKQLNREGNYEEGQRLLNGLIQSPTHQNDPLVVAADRKHNDPIATNPAVTSKHAANVDAVRRFLYLGQSAHNLGQFDKSIEFYDKVLRLDPTNQAARRGQQRAHHEIRSYARAASDEARDRLLSNVDKAWEIEPIRKPFDGAIVIGDNSTAGPVQYSIRESLSDIMIDRFDVEDMSVQNVIQRFRMLVAENSVDKKGFNIVLSLGGETNLEGQRIAKTPVSLKVKNLPADALLDLICKQTKMAWTADEFVITVLPRGQAISQLLRRTFIVPPNFLDRPIGDAPKVEDGVFGEPDKVAREDVTVQGYLEKMGVTFPKGSSVQYAPSVSMLTVVNTTRNMNVIADAIEKLKMSQNVIVNVRLRVVDVLQHDLEELGYDWLLAPNKLQGGTSGLWVGGGNASSGTPITPIQLDGQPQITSSALTSGLRSGNGAFPLTGIESRLNQNINLSQLSASQVRAPAIMQATAYLNDSHVQVMMRGLSQKKGTSRIWSPSVSTMSGQQARLTQVRQFIYPTEYDPPGLPDQVGGFGATPIAPAMPTSFEERPVGMIFDIQPVVGPDRRLINLDINTGFSEFLGFVDYGSPILMLAADPLTGLPVTMDYTPNNVLMPIFQQTQIRSNVTIADGATIAIGGVTRTEIATLNDRVPVLSSLPFVGDFFKSNGTKTIKRAVVIFASAELVDPTGEKWRDSDF